MVACKVYIPSIALLIMTARMLADIFRGLKSFNSQTLPHDKRFHMMKLIISRMLPYDEVFQQSNAFVSL